MLTYNTIIVLLGTGLLGASAGLVGSFAVLRRRALTGDALAHAALPGLCLAFLLLEKRSMPALLLGALATGVLGVATVTALRRFTRTKEDAAIGIVLSVFFGAGIVLSRIVQNRSAVGSKAGLDSYILGKTAGIIAQDVLIVGSVAAASLLVIVLLYKEFKLVSFDPAFAGVQGWPVGPLDLAIMGLIALTVVFGLPAVGVVLMAALLIIPGAAARFWTDRLGRMLVLSGAFGLVIGLVGTAFSARYSGLPAGPIIVLVGTCLLLLSVFFAPRRGMVARLIAEANFRRDLDERDLLRIVHDLVEPDLPTGRAVGAGEIRGRKPWSSRRLARLLDRAVAEGQLRPIVDGPELVYVMTGVGQSRGAALARDRRLWRLYFHEHPEQAVATADLGRASVKELLTPELVAELESLLQEEDQRSHDAPSDDRDPAGRTS